MFNLLSALNPAQREAVSHKDGPLLIMAGAGSGKTKVLTYRIASLVASGARPSEILAVTFTNKAAGEMKEGVRWLMAGSDGHAVNGKEQIANSNWNKINRSPFAISSLPWVGTFHSLGAFILRENAAKAGLIRRFTIIDEEDALGVLKEIFKEMALDPKQFQPARIRGIISSQKGELIDRPTYAEANEGEYLPQVVGKIWEKYEEKLTAAHAVDFDDLLLKTVRLFENHPEILKKYQERWRYVNIDEYQDTNHAQYVLSNLLAQRHNNICVVGDVDQCIYSWRGADFRNILAFERDWPGAKEIKLEENYRSTKTILDAANSVIEKNKERKPKILFTSKSGGDQLEFFAAADESAEAEFIAAKSKEFITSGIPASEIAVLFRTNFQSRVLEEEFLKENIPYRVTGVKFYNRKEVKDILAYMRAALNPKDMISVKRIINEPARGIGKVLFTRFASGLNLSATDERKIAPFLNILAEVRESVEKLPASKAIRQVLHKTGYYKLWGTDSEEGAMRIGNLQELVTIARRYDELDAPGGIEKLLEDAALMSEQDNFSERKESVSLMTTHAAKGLEFDYVFISGLEDGLFPHAQAGGEDDDLRMEEERRLFYVALTRARKNIFLSYAFFRTIFGEKRVNEPSRFLFDIPKELFKNVAGAGDSVIQYS